MLDIVPELAENITDIHVDFEIANLNSLKKKFPRARIVGCAYHFKHVRTKYLHIFYLLII